MRSSTALSLLLFAFTPFCLCLPHYSLPLADREQLIEDPAPRDDFPLPQYFLQRQDHFDGANSNTWYQAYYVNDTFWDSSDPTVPVFLCVGGEGPPLDGSVVVASVHCNVAVEWLQEKRALMFALEHRYYGCHNMSACPVKSFDSPADLKFQSSRQALADIAAFHAFATDKYNLQPTNRWVTWGGSYPGMLAAWARLKFPHLFFAAVSSSAPVRAQLDMVGYNDVVTQAFNTTSVGGSPACVSAISSGHALIGQMMNGSDQDRITLAQLFSISDPSLFLSVDFQTQFAGEGVAVFDAQSNDPACTDPCCNIERVCAVMTNESAGSVLDRLVALRKCQGLQLHGKGLREAEIAATLGKTRTARSMETGSSVKRWRDNYYNKNKNNNNNKAQIDYDFWSYQTCAEFAFYQTCEIGSQCMYTQGLSTLDVNMQFCWQLFNISKDTVIANVEFSNVYYGADAPEGSRVLWVNGEVDPWHALAVLVSPRGDSVDQPTMWVPGASHHFWTHPSKPTDSAEVVRARQDIRAKVAEWLSQA